MVTDARAQADLIAELHLEALFNLSHLGGIEPMLAHTGTHDSIQLRERLEFVRSVAVRAQGLTVKIEMAKAASTKGQ